jgi:hypothetical protein
MVFEKATEEKYNYYLQFIEPVVVLTLLITAIITLTLGFN